MKKSFEGTTKKQLADALVKAHGACVVDTVTGGAALIEQVADDWCGSESKSSIYTITIRKARSLSKDPDFNLACYLKYSFVLEGETDEDWLHTVSEIKKILGVQP